MNDDVANEEDDGTGLNIYPGEQAKLIRGIVADLENADHGAPLEEVLDRAEENGYGRVESKTEIERQQKWGALYEPEENMLRVT